MHVKINYRNGSICGGLGPAGHFDQTKMTRVRSTIAAACAG